MSKQGGERGNMAAVEAAILLPVVLLIVGLVIVLGRNALAEQAVGAAAASAARAASIERTTSAATTAAHDAVEGALGESNITCSTKTVSVNASGVSSPAGVPASVSVTVSCDVVHDLSLPGFPSTSHVSATRTSPVDTYRSN